MNFKSKLRDFVLKYGNSDFFLERNMCLCSRPDLQKRPHLAGYVGFMGGEFYFYLLPKAMSAALNSDELNECISSGLVSQTVIDVFDRLRKVSVYSVKASNIGINTEYFDPHDDYRQPEWVESKYYDYAAN